MRLLLGQVTDDGLAVVCAARAPNLVKLGVQQLFQPFATAANPRMMEFDFEGLK